MPVSSSLVRAVRTRGTGPFFRRVERRDLLADLACFCIVSARRNFGFDIGLESVCVCGGTIAQTGVSVMFTTISVTPCKAWPTSTEAGQDVPLVLLNQIN